MRRAWKGVVGGLCLVAAATGSAQAVDAPGGPPPASGAELLGVSGDGFVHVEWAAKPGPSGQERVSGYVYNDWGEYADTVQLRITALDASGHVTASVVTPVRDVPPGERVYFEVLVPGQGQSYRVAVDAHDFVERGIS